MRRLARLSLVLLFVAATARAAGHPEMLVSTTWLHQHLYDRHVTILEVGDLESYRQAHILGSRFVPLADLLVQRDGTPNELPDIAALERTFGQAGLPDRGRIVIYARDPIAAARAFFTLDYVGRGEEISILDGGFARWELEGLPMTGGKPLVAPRLYTAHPRPDALVRLPAMRILSEVGALMPSEVALIDARSTDQFCGAQPGEGVTRPGHIANAMNVPWSENLGAGQAALYRSADDLRELYRRAGVMADATVVTYCRTGMLASVNYFVLRYLGRDVRLYDGSYIEWSRASEPGLPIASAESQ